MTPGYAARRAGQALFVVWAAFTLSFAVLYLLPGDPIQTMLGSGGEVRSVPPEQVAALRHEYGFDRSLPVQYLSRLGHALHGDFGRSTTSGAPVTTVIRDALPATLALTAGALVLAVVGGTLLALVASVTRFGPLQQLLLSFPALGISVPTFLTGLVLLQVASFRWGLFPATGNQGLRSVVLPAITLSIPVGAQIAQVLARSLRTTLDEPYVTEARAKGASHRRVVFRHALRNAAIPAMTLAGVITGKLLASAVVVETVFSRAGLGRVTQLAVDRQDIPVVQGIVVTAAIVFAVVSLVTDLLYPFVDPRVGVVTQPA